MDAQKKEGKKEEFFIRLFAEGIVAYPNTAPRVVGVSGQDQVLIEDGKNGIAGYTFTMNAGSRNEGINSGYAFAKLTPYENRFCIEDATEVLLAETADTPAQGGSILLEWRRGSQEIVPVFTREEAEKAAMLAAPLEVFYWKLDDVLENHDVLKNGVRPMELPASSVKKLRYELTDLIGTSVGEIAAENFAERLQDLAASDPKIFEPEVFVPKRLRNRPKM